MQIYNWIQKKVQHWKLLVELFFYRYRNFAYRQQHYLKHNS
jgi:hypothetical protein